jgi:hypothetical protein
VDREHFNRHRSDVERIVSVFAARGVVLHPLSAYEGWCEHSDHMAAGWLFLDEEDEELYNNVTQALARLVE